MQLNIVEQELLTTIHSLVENKKSNIIEELINNPLIINGDSTPLKREKIYESRED